MPYRELPGIATVISRTVLVATESFGEGLDAKRAAAAIGRGLRAGDPSLTVDLCALDGTVPSDTGPSDTGPSDARLLAARAVVLGAERLDERMLLGSATFALATRARQAGVPAYAVTAANALSRFDARILDLQVVLQARDARALRRSGEQLAALV
jgi:glycerate kinase